MEKKYKCDLCGRCFAKKSTLVAHITTHTKEKPYVCSTCNKGFTQRANLKNHMPLHSDERLHACKLCDKKFTLKKQLAYHIRSFHKEKPFACEKCGRTFSSRLGFTSHLKSHANQITYACRICKAVFPTKGNLTIHMGIHLNPSNQVQSVSQKDKQLSSEVLSADLSGKSQIEQMHGIGMKCTEDMQNSDHINNDKDVNMELVSELFAGDKDKVYEKIDGKEPIAEEQPDNGVNGRIVCAKIDLEKEMQIIASVNYHTCEICSKCFSNAKTFLKHKRTHMNERPFKCETCSKSFSEKGELDSHVLKHKRGKQFTCHVCSKDFAWKGALKRHLSVHSQEKPYKCLVCYKSFSEKGNLVVHMRIHTGEKPYVCQVCSRAFTTNASMLGHMSTHMRKKPTTDQIDRASFPSYDDVLTDRTIHTPENSLDVNLYPNAKKCSGKEGSEDNTDQKDIEQDEYVAKVCEEQEPLLESSLEKVEQMCDVKSHLQEKATSNQVGRASSYADVLIHGKSCSPETNLTENLPADATQCSSEAVSTDITCEEDMEQDEYVAKVCEEQEPFLESSLEKVEKICDVKTHLQKKPTNNQVGRTSSSHADVLMHGKSHSPETNLTENLPANTTQCSSKAVSTDITCEEDMEQNEYAAKVCEEQEPLLGSSVEKVEKRCDVSVKKGQRASRVRSKRKKEKPFVCELCKRAFAQKIFLKWHLKQSRCAKKTEKNTIKKTYTCDVCGRTFPQKAHLTAHLEAHDNRLRYGCRICKTAFPTKGALIIHMGIHINLSTQLQDVRPKDEQLSIEMINADLDGEKDMEKNHDIGEKCKVDVQNSDHVKNEKEEDMELGSDSFTIEKDEVYQDIDVKEHVVEEETDNGFSGSTICAKIDLEKNMQIIAPQKTQTCEICNKCFSKSFFQRHKRTHMTKPFECEICSKIFYVKAGLESHMLTHKPVKNFTCHVCSKGFKWKGALKRHLVVHSREKPYKCLACPSSFSDRCNLVKHMRYFHTGEKPFVCQVCSRAFSSKAHMLSHMKVHSLEKPFIGQSLSPQTKMTENLHLNGTQCFGGKSIANIPFEKGIEQNEHVAKVCEEQEPLFESSLEKVEVICDESVEVVEVVRQCNEGGAEGREIVKAVDIFCEGVLRADVHCKSIDKKQVVPVHPESIGVACQTVEKIEVSEPFLAEDDQAAEHTFSEREKITVDKEVCGKTSCSETNLVAHMELYKRLNKKKTTHTCHVCSKDFDSKAGLASHMRIHAEEKPFACSECGKAFSWKSSLVNHMKVHIPEKSLLCKVCNKAISWKETLEEHMQTHAEPKYFTCETCNQSFLESAQLEEHKKMHAVMPVNQVQYVLLGLPIIVINQ